MQLHQLLRHGTPTAMSFKTYGSNISIDRKSPIFCNRLHISMSWNKYSKSWKCGPHMSQNMFRRAQEKHDPEYGKELVLHYLPPPPDSDGNIYFFLSNISWKGATKECTLNWVEPKSGVSGTTVPPDQPSSKPSSNKVFVVRWCVGQSYIGARLWEEMLPKLYEGYFHCVQRHLGSRILEPNGGTLESRM